MKLKRGGEVSGIRPGQNVAAHEKGGAFRERTGEAEYEGVFPVAIEPELKAIGSAARDTPIPCGAFQQARHFGPAKNGNRHGARNDQLADAR